MTSNTNRSFFDETDTETDVLQLHNVRLQA